MSQLPLVARTEFNMKPWSNTDSVVITHWVFLAIITFT